VLGLVVMAIGGSRLGPRARLIAIGLLAAVAIQVYLNSIIYDWWGQASYGARRLCSMTMPLVVGLAVWIHVLGRAVARWPRIHRAVWHVATLVVLGWFVAWNLSWVSLFSAGRAPERRAGPICCKEAPAPLASIAEPIYRRVGNPFALPASAVFALRHGVSPRRWDQVIGEYPFMPSMLYTADSIRGAGGDWNLGGPGATPFLIHGVGGVVRGSGRGIRYTTARKAEMFVPNLLPQRMRVTWLLTPQPGAPVDVVVRWNGDVVVRQTLSAPTTVSWTIEGDVGTNVLTVEAPAGAIGVGMLRVAGA
jgi:hypothetical protein